MRAALALRLVDLFGDEPAVVPVRGHSMEPLLCDGDVVRLERVTALRAGDLVVFPETNGRLVLHRLLGSYRRGGRRWLLTQGDAAPLPDVRVAPESVLFRAAVSVSATDRLRARLRYLRHALRVLLRR